MQEFHHLHDDSRKLVEEQMIKQELMIAQLTEEIQKSPSSQNTPIPIASFDGEAQQRLQAQIVFKTGVLIVSTSVVTLLISFWFYQK